MVKSLCTLRVEGYALRIKPIFIVRYGEIHPFGIACNVRYEKGKNEGVCAELVPLETLTAMHTLTQDHARNVLH